MGTDPTFDADDVVGMLTILTESEVANHNLLVLHLQDDQAIHNDSCPCRADAMELNMILPLGTEFDTESALDRLIILSSRVVNEMRGMFSTTYVIGNVFCTEFEKAHYYLAKKIDSKIAAS